MPGEFRYLVSDAASYDGWYLLPILQTAVNQMAGAAPEGDGTADKPYRLTTPQHWLQCVRTVKALGNNQKRYIVIWGRLLCVDHRCYVSDVGPAWRKGEAPQQVTPGSHPAAQNYVTKTSNLDDWKRRNTEDEPSYRGAAQKILDPRRVYIEAPEGMPPMTWGEAASSPMVAKAMRFALRGESLWTERQQAEVKVRDYSRLQKLIPVMTVAWFLAEPARNLRVFLLNLMLLDIAQRGRALDFASDLTWDRLFWGPEILNFTRQEGVLRPLVGDGRQAPVSDMDRTMRQVTTFGDLWTLGGVMSASPLGGANKTAKKDIPTQRVDAIYRSAVAQGKRGNNYTLDYIHLKEISIATLWVQLRFPAYRAARERPGDRPFDATPAIPIAQDIQNRFLERSGSFAYQ